MSMSDRRAGPILLALVAAVMWGLGWAPIRLLEDAGLQGAWAGIGMNLGALPLLALVAAFWSGRGTLTRRAVLGAALVGVAVTLYATALTLTEVVRAVLLFYLAPAWSTAIECLFLGRRWTRRSLLALALSSAGVVTIFRADLSASGWGVGDLLALGSGLAWSSGSALIFTAPPPGIRRLAFVTCLSALCTGGLVVALNGGDAAALPAAADLAGVAPLALASGLLYLAPIILITLWSALVLPPATLSFLLTAEIVSGVASSAVFLDERFGLPEGAGALLVALGAVFEVVSEPKRHTA